MHREADPWAFLLRLIVALIWSGIGSSMKILRFRSPWIRAETS